MKVKKKSGKGVGTVYPCLKEHADGTVIFFIDSDRGMVVYVPPEEKNLYLGQYEEDWCESEFKEYSGQLIMEN